MIDQRCIGHFQHLKVGVSTCGKIGILQLARPQKANAFNATLWAEFPKAVQLLDHEEGVHVVLLVAAGKNFCAGIDTAFLAETFGHASSDNACRARSSEQLRQGILAMQEAFTSLERCRWPVIAAVQGACVGAGVDLLAACDLRLCSADAIFCVKEIDLAMAADLGSLQRLPHIVGLGVAAELALTGRNVSGEEAVRLRLVSSCWGSVEELHGAAEAAARQLAGKSQVALMGTKKMLLHARSHSVQEGLEHVAQWNSSMLLSADMEQVIAARSAPRRSRPRQQPERSKL